MSGPVNRPAAMELPYNQAEIDAMSKEDLLLLYKSSGCEELKWPLALRYVGLRKRRRRGMNWQRIWQS